MYSRDAQILSSQAKCPILAYSKRKSDTLLAKMPKSLTQYMERHGAIIFNVKISIILDEKFSTFPFMNFSKLSDV